MRATGLGWIGSRGWGSGQAQPCLWQSPETFERRLSSPPLAPGPRHYGRFDRASRLVCHALQLALADAGYGAARSLPEGSGLIGTGDMGTLAANQTYYSDYVRHGKLLGRSNLFLYTLPTSALAEAAIFWRLRGPLLHLGGGTEHDAHAFTIAEDLLSAGGAPCVLVCVATADSAVVTVLERSETKDPEERAAAIAAAFALRRVAAGQDGSRA
jgi:3-oxoacyl-(acyl-carrier-protein) synthase